MKIIKQIIALSLLTTTMTFASSDTSLINTKYAVMSTVELEEKVETLSQTGELPFEMGLELIKRWSKV